MNKQQIILPSGYNTISNNYAKIIISVMKMTKEPP